MKQKMICILLCLLLVLPMLAACEGKPAVHRLSGEAWYMGFASEEITIPDTEQPLYIAGYNNGKEITGVLDNQRANAVWLDTGSDGILLIGIDCVGLSRPAIQRIRGELREFTKSTGCAQILIWSTHTHAGIDTLGLWGEIAIDGKNDAFSENLVAAAVRAAKAAHQSRTAGTLYYGSVPTHGMLRDSRLPHVYDADMHIFRFSPDDGSGGIRIINYAAHPESLRGDNTMVSRDYPGVMSDIIRSRTGDDMLFMPGALGGLIMTEVLCEGEFDAAQNLRLTGERLADYALSDYSETALSPTVTAAGCEMEIPLDNLMFMNYRFLGILENNAYYRVTERGYAITSELSLLTLGNVTLAMIPGEIFPELVYGGYLTDTAAAPAEENPRPLTEIAAESGIGELLICSLAGDELGYIIPPNDFLLNQAAPYINGITDAKGENHYEETNSASPALAHIIAESFENLLRAMQ